MNKKFLVAVKRAVMSLFFVAFLVSSEDNYSSAQNGEKDPMDLGSRLELFVDDFLVESLSGAAVRRMHRPNRREVIHTLDKPWEGNSSAYLSVIHDREEDRVLLYFNASPEGPYGQTTALLLSEDGINFTRPELGLVNYRGSEKNNLLPIRQRFGAAGHHFTPFLDENPDAPDDERFKAIARPVFSVYASSDGIDWRRLSDEPGVDHGPTDSQNLAFWDPVREIYVGYIRAKPEERGGIRDIRRTISGNFLDWSEPELIHYKDDRQEHMYTNGIRPYFRAPHIFIGLPNRFMTGRQKIPEHPNRGINDVVLMSSRDGRVFDRWPEAFIRPGPDPEVWTDRNNYPAWGMIQTAPEEISLYWTEHYRYPGMRIRRGTIRIDGFASLHAGGEGGEMLTRPLTFSGDRLVVNYHTSAAGDIQFELADNQGEPIPGFSFDDSETLFGNDIEHMVAWRGKTDLSGLKDREVRMRVRLKDADLYSIRFDTDENIRARLEDSAAEARRMLHETRKPFAGRRREELSNRKKTLEERLANDNQPTQNWLSDGALLQRAKHHYRQVIRAEKRALNAINGAENVMEQEVGFGRLHQGAVEVLLEKLKTALADQNLSAAHVEELTGRLSGAVDDFMKTEKTRKSAMDSVQAADEVLDEPAEGFGRLFQERIERRRDGLHDLLADERTATGAVREAIDGLERAVARLQEVRHFPPVHAREVAGAPASLSLRTGDDWARGLLVNTMTEGDDLMLIDEVMLRFGGEDEYVECALVDDLRSEVVTVEAWVKAQKSYYRQWYPIVLLGREYGEEERWTEHAYNIWVDGDRLQFTLGSRDDGPLVRTRRGPRMELGKWQHMAARFDGEEARIYLNGRLMDTAEYQGNIDYSVADVVRIGGSLGKYCGFEGKIRDVRIWNTVRTEQQIRDNMYAEPTGEEEGLVGHWIAGRDAGEGNTLHDRSVLSNDGQIHGASWVLPEGYHLSGPVAFPDIHEVRGSSIRWDATMGGDARHAEVDVQVGMSQSAGALPEKWRRADSGEAIPFIEPGMNLSEKHVWLKTHITAKDPSARVRLHEMELEVE